jgi:hypothetical protein
LLRCVSLFPEYELGVAVIPRLEEFADFCNFGSVIEESTVYSD